MKKTPSTKRISGDELVDVLAKIIPDRGLMPSPQAIFDELRNVLHPPTLPPVSHYVVTAKSGTRIEQWFFPEGSTLGTGNLQIGLRPKDLSLATFEPAIPCVRHGHILARLGNKVITAVDPKAFDAKTAPPPVLLKPESDKRKSRRRRPSTWTSTEKADD